MKALANIFKKRTATLDNGTIVRLGDTVSFINSDGIKCTNTIKERADGTLYFWNITHEIKDYKSAYKEG